MSDLELPPARDWCFPRESGSPRLPNRRLAKGLQLRQRANVSDYAAHEAYECQPKERYTPTRRMIRVIHHRATALQWR